MIKEVNYCITLKKNSVFLTRNKSFYTYFFRSVFGGLLDQGRCSTNAQINKRKMPSKDKQHVKSALLFNAEAECS